MTGLCVWFFNPWGHKFSLGSCLCSGRGLIISGAHLQSRSQRMNAPTGILVTAVRLLSFDDDCHQSSLFQKLGVVHAANRVCVTAARSCY